nr:hypothetical protein [Geminicoccus roseus]
MDQVAHLFRVETLAQFRGTDQIDEHDRELSPPCRRRVSRSFGIQRSLVRPGVPGWRRPGAKHLDRIEHAPAVADGGDTDFLQVVGGQPDEQAETYVMLAEVRAVLLQPQSA